MGLVAGVAGRRRFEQQDRNLFLGNGPVLYPARDDQKIVLAQLDGAVAEFHGKLPLKHVEKLVFIVVLVPDKSPFEFGQLDVLPVEFADNSRVPVVGKQGEFFRNVHFFRHDLLFLVRPSGRIVSLFLWYFPNLPGILLQYWHRAVKLAGHPIFPVNRRYAIRIPQAKKLTFAKIFPKRMKKLVVYTFFLACLLPKLAAQDQQFTQFYASPLMLNPGLTGVFEGRYRVGTIYRDQWRKVLDNPIRTFAVAADLRFKAPGKRISGDALGLGLMFFNDKVNVVDFSTTQIAISLAYHKALSSDNRQYLSLGIQGGLSQRNLNYESLEFQDEFDGVSGYVLPTGEVLPGNNFAYPDLNVGLNYSARFGRTGGVYAGVALHHVTEPDVSFFSNGDKGEKLFRKISGQLSANIPIRNSRTSFLPRVLFAKQGPHMQINAGANFRTALGKYGSTALHLGGWVRPVRTEESFGLDAVVALVGVEINNVLFGLSYDLNPGALAFNQRQGAFEISIAYLGNYENEEILCPKF